MNNVEDRLCGKTILQVLQGDTVVGFFVPGNSNEKIQLQLPYLSGPDICDIASKFGITIKYGGMISRWQYMHDLVAGCIKSGKLSRLLHYIFSHNHIAQRFTDIDRSVLKQVCEETVNAVMECINNELVLGDAKLCMVGDRYEIQQMNDAFVPNVSNVECLNSEYIHRLAERAYRDIKNADFDGAISKARTLLEEIFCFMIERQNGVVPDKGDIVKLYNQVKDMYQMHSNKDADIRINDLLSGINKIVDSVSRMRNISGDSHGLGSRRIGVATHHAMLVVNVSCCLAEFMLSVCDNRISQ